LKAIRAMGRGERIFEGILPRVGLSFLKADLAAAGLAYEHDGERRDFHAFRHTACTWGAMTGEDGPLLQAFMSHKSPSQTARYTHVQHLPQNRILESMPIFDVQQLWTLIGTLGNVQNSQLLSSNVSMAEQHELLTDAVIALKNSGKAHKKDPPSGGPSQYPLRDLNPCLQDENLMS